MIEDPGVVGLTEEGMRLDSAMAAVWSEFMVVQWTGEKEPLFDVDPGVMMALARRFDDLWRPFGVERGPLKTDIVARLADEPLSIEEIAEETTEGTPMEVEEAVETLLEAGILTRDENAMWIVD